MVISVLDDGVQQCNNHMTVTGDRVQRYGDPSAG
jgi:hypothetical protein